MAVKIISDFLELTKSKQRNNKPLLARAISMVENEVTHAAELLNAIFSFTGRAARIGITGAPGAGKSTLVNGLAKRWVDLGKTIGIIAVDPTSPFTGGAILGDRVRMNDIGLEANIFMRSMATRGSMGGLVKTARQVADLMDAYGMDLILYETVGVGQSEIDIIEHADISVVVLVPESGDSVQAMKAGLMEIADVFVLNKSDRAGADFVQKELLSVIELRPANTPLPKVIKTIASEKIGIEDTALEIEELWNRMNADGSLNIKRRVRLERELLHLIGDQIQRQWHQERWKDMIAGYLARIQDFQISPYEAAQEIFLQLPKS